ncbi:riboflavin biosynthesis protein RibD [Leptospira perolatii]|uniref:Riboflavin biosynthesis protein RibD n=1 Tax=Leptospira perolatii TaxID=2023191 RepID=A0A2M9ZN06_9LEPT|nr:dihydrofolate reductase family protein [Leptospira perolatii]PJZ68915.1 riboflavin biosynthesis protein RibD [Leptospira perolatii]PJZ73466.1 riboflavin biosynthesis protein RibD [Leptospira perolatii]
MRKLIMWNVVTLDGYFEGEQNWDLSFHELVWGDELEEFSLTQLKSADMLLFGATTYKGMADYWTKAEGDAAEGEIARFMNKIQKVVCTSTLKTADWNNTTIVRNAAVEIAKLKQQGEGNMFVFGSGNLSESLLKAELFDEIRLCIAPAFLGKGKLLFHQGIPHKKLKVLESRLLTTGGILLRYAPLL